MVIYSQMLTVIAQGNVCKWWHKSYAIYQAFLRNDSYHVAGYHGHVFILFNAWHQTSRAYKPFTCQKIHKVTSYLA